MRLNFAATRADFSFALYRLATRPELLLAGLFLVVLGTLVLSPLIEIIRDAITYQSYDLAYRPDAKEGEFTWFHLERVFASDLTTALFLTPLTYLICRRALFEFDVAARRPADAGEGTTTQNG